MKKMVVFNVGGALCSYLSIGDNRTIVDLGKSESFNPVTDFLIPHFKKNGYATDENGKYRVSQLLISHPHMDHISAILDFDKYCVPGLLTCPNDKKENKLGDRLDISKFDDESDEVKKLREMYRDRSLPLEEEIEYGDDDKQYLFYIRPGNVESDDMLSVDECYQNNVSLVCLFVINGHRVLLPGDIMRNGMKKLLNDNRIIQKELRNHELCILVAPHHGLKSSFPESLFNVIKGGRTRCLNIVSEKTNSPNDTRIVDPRYSKSDYCVGDNDLSSTNGSNANCQRKTSQGHICIDFTNASRPDICIINNTDELIDWFAE